MKIVLKTGLISFLFLSTTTHALNPMSGPYAGLVVGASYVPKSTLEFTNPLTYGTTTLTAGTLAYDIMGNIGGQIGYRLCDNYRIEGEFTYNFVPYAYLTLNDVTFHTPDSSTGVRMRGNRAAGIGFINAYYDAFGNFSSNTVPYVGVGVGYAYLYNFVEFFSNDVYISGTRKSMYTARAAGQVILGLSYYMDDFAAFSIDGRYLSTATGQVTTSRGQEFNTNMQTYSMNLVFNGAFDLA